MSVVTRRLRPGCADVVAGPVERALDSLHRSGEGAGGRRQEGGRSVSAILLDTDLQLSHGMAPHEAGSSPHACSSLESRRLAALRPKCRGAVEVLCPVGTEFGTCLVDSVGLWQTSVLVKTDVGWVAVTDRPFLPVTATPPIDAVPVVRLVEPRGERGSAVVDWELGHRSGRTAVTTRRQLDEVRRFFTPTA